MNLNRRGPPFVTRLTPRATFPRKGEGQEDALAALLL